MMSPSASSDSVYKILIVDDDIHTRSALVRLLSEKAVVSAASGAYEALDILGQGRFDAVLTDYKMPERDGVWLLAQVRSLHPAVRRFLISGLLPSNVEQLVEGGLVHKAVDRTWPRDEILSLVGS